MQQIFSCEHLQYLDLYGNTYNQPVDETLLSSKLAQVLLQKQVNEEDYKRPIPLLTAWQHELTRRSTVVALPLTPAIVVVAADSSRVSQHLSVANGSESSALVSESVAVNQSLVMMNRSASLVVPNAAEGTIPSNGTTDTEIIAAGTEQVQAHDKMHDVIDNAGTSNQDDPFMLPPSTASDTPSASSESENSAQHKRSRRRGFDNEQQLEPDSPNHIVIILHENKPKYKVRWSKPATGLPQRHGKERIGWRNMSSTQRSCKRGRTDHR